MDLDEDTLQTKTIYEGRIFRVEQALVKLPDGKVTCRDVVNHPGAVAILAWPTSHDILLVQQLRYATGEQLWEIPAGKLEPGEKPAACAARELSEETGFWPQQLEHIHSFYTSPGFSSELLHLFNASNLSPAQGTTDADEFLESRKIPLTKALGMLNQGKIKDAKTIIALLWANQELNA